jgi:hypothetical protein
MPNPFTGMDPWLEGDLWITVHTDLWAEIARQLATASVVLGTRPKEYDRAAQRAGRHTPHFL